MRLYNLGKVPWIDSQLIYHALAELGTEALSLVSPATPYVCIGFHQDAEQEVDLEYCRSHQIPVFRRDLGGGTVYLDGDQLFFHLILRKDNPQVPRRKEAFYQKFLQPIVNVYRHLGIAAKYKPINDVIVGNRKISGTGVGEIGDCVVFVGNLILDFNFDEMAQVLKVPDEKFRDKVYKTLRDNLTTIRKELGEQAAKEWDEARLNSMMAEEFQALLGPMEPSQKDRVLQAKMDDMAEWMRSEDWLFRRGKKIYGRDVKIRSGLNLRHKAYKAPGGLIQSDFEIMDGCFHEVSLSGDFFCFPQEAVGQMEKALEGKRIEDAKEILRSFYSDEQVDTPGICVEDWIEVLTP
jgi:lipoate-protein ligase A